MSARGWTLLHNAPGFSEEHRLDGTTLHRFRMQAKDVEQLLSDIPPVHFATQVWTDSGGNLVRYALDRRCAYETAGMHSVYVTVRVTFFTPAQYRDLKTRARTEADVDRVRVLPTPKPTPWP